MMEVKFEVKMTQKVMYNFLMNHTYRSMTGISGVLFGVAALQTAAIFTALQVSDGEKKADVPSGA